MYHKTFDSYLLDRFGMNEEQFRRELQKNNASYHYNAERPDAIIECYRKKWRNEFDRVSLDQIELTFLEWWESYYKLNPARFHEICVSTGTTARQESVALEWFRRRWMQHDELVKLGQCPF